MNAAKQAAWLLITLLLLAGSGWYFASTTPIIKLDDETLSTTPDTIINHLTVQQFDAQGELSHYLQSPSMQHIPLHDMHQFQTPHILIAQANQPAWEIDALQAIAINKGKKIIFETNVVIHQQADQQRKETTFNTQQLTYFPKKQLATTKQDITLIQDKNIVRSQGMKAYLADNHIQLLNNARGTYVPNQG